MASFVRKGELMTPEIHIVFDGPPGPESGRFVEVETPWGRSIKAGEWKQRGEYWVLVLTPDDFPTEEEAREEGEANSQFGVGS